MQRPYRPQNSNRREPVVEDLREKLNRIKQEKALNAEGTKNPPPPDPTYNFLKDPLRGDGCANLGGEKKVGNKHENVKHEMKCGSNSHDVEQKNLSKPIERSPRENRKVNFDKKSEASSGWQRQNWRSHTPRDEQQPRKWKGKTVPQQPAKHQSVNNIKVILSNESGERKCTIDETVLVQIPLIAGKDHTLKPKTEKWSQKGSQKHDSDKNKPMFSGKNKEPNEEDTNKQLQTEIGNENKHQTKTLNQNDPKAQTIANIDQKVEILANNDQKAETIANNNQKVETIASNDQKTETLAKNDQKAKTIANVDQKVETIANNDQKAKTIANIDQKAETIANNGQKAETLVNNDQKGETIANNDQKVETIANNDQKAKTIANIGQKSETIANNDQKAETLVNNDQKGETIANNDQKVETIANNDQKAETLVNNDQKAETLANNDQKAKTIANIDPKVETIVNNEQNAETIANNNTGQSIIKKEMALIIGNDDKTEQTKDEEQKPVETVTENDVQSTTDEGNSRSIQK